MVKDGFIVHFHNLAMGLSIKLESDDQSSTEWAKKLDSLGNFGYSLAIMKLVSAYTPRARRRRQTPGLEIGVF